jgi:hypothetical protein
MELTHVVIVFLLSIFIRLRNRLWLLLNFDITHRIYLILNWVGNRIIVKYLVNIIVSLKKKKENNK